VKREVWLVALAGFLAVNVVIGFHYYAAGKQTVALKATKDSLSVVVDRSKEIEAERDLLATGLREQMKRTDSTRTVYVHDKAKVALHGDTAVTKDSSQVLLPEVAERIRAADAHIANLEAENATLKFALHTDSSLIANQAEQIRLNQNIAKMVKGSRLSHGFQVGGGYCATRYGNSPCAFVGYGLQVRLP
jgi:hypothetical protein